MNLTSIDLRSPYIFSLLVFLLHLTISYIVEYNQHTNRYLRARCLLAALGLGIDIKMLVQHGWEIGDIINEINHINA